VSRFKRLASCLVALCALSAALTSTAWAASPQWFVAGTALKTGEQRTIAEATTVTEAFEIKTSQVTVVCPSLKLEKSLIEGEKARSDHAMILEGCEDVTATRCKVGTITSKPLSSVLEGEKGKLKLNFKPTSGEEVTTIKISGAECAAEMTFVVSGTMACNYPGVETEAVDHKLEFSASSGSKLKAFGVAAELKGNDTFWLTSEKMWSAH
jgi:hypothetical protein